MQIQEDPIFGPYEGKGNLLLFPASTSSQPGWPGAIGCRERLGGLLKYYRLWCKMSGVDKNGEVSLFVSVDELFAGRNFDAEIVLLCVRWYLSFKLSYRDLVSMMSERGIRPAHTTILRWVQHYTPEFEKRWQRYARPVGGSWRMDEIYVKVRGEWVYLYRAVDKAGKTVDFLLSPQRDVNAAKAFLRKAMNGQSVPTKVTLDAYAVSHRAVAD